MRTDHVMTQCTGVVLQALDDARWFVHRHSELVDLLAQKDSLLASQRAYIVKLEGMEADHEADVELLELLVGWWSGNVEYSGAEWVRINQLLKERTSADGLAHDSVDV